MINFKNRVPAVGKVNRKRITPEGGAAYYAVVETADDGEAGTAINRANMMAMQGFAAYSVVKNNDGSYTQTMSDGSVITVRKAANGDYVETLTKGTQMATLTVSRTINGWQGVLS